MKAARDNTGKPKLAEIHWFEHGLAALAAHIEAGRDKYPDVDGVPNWTLGGKDDAEYLNAIERHLGKLVRGETHDTKEDENGKPGLRTLHAAAIAWNALALITLNQKDLPVRLPSSTPETVSDIKVGNRVSYTGGLSGKTYEGYVEAIEGDYAKVINGSGTSGVPLRRLTKVSTPPPADKLERTALAQQEFGAATGGPANLD